MSWLAPTKILPFLSYLAATAAGVLTPAPPSTTAAINASGVNVFWEASNEPDTPNLVVAESNPNTSPFKAVVCWITIPPSPAEVDPEAILINLSATSKSSVCWKDAVPVTTKFLDTVKSLVTVKSRPIVTSSGNAIVTLSSETVVTISLPTPSKSNVPVKLEH